MGRGRVRAVPDDAANRSGRARRHGGARAPRWSVEPLVLRDGGHAPRRVGRDVQGAGDRRALRADARTMKWIAVIVLASCASPRPTPTAIATPTATATTTPTAT